MSRKEAMDALIESGMELRRDDIELGKQLERERIIQVAQNRICFDHKGGCDHADCYALSDLIRAIKGEQK